jgi:hypothetical protein
MRTFAAILLFTLGAMTARADTGYAYALISDGTLATVNPTYTLNPAGGPVTASHNSTGSYTVTFPNLSIATGWAVEAAAYGATANYCNVAGWGLLGINVQCYNPSGAAANSPFTVLAISNGNDKNILFAWADQPTAANYNANSSYAYNLGGSVGITRSGPGEYVVSFGLNSANGGAIQIDAYNSNANCYSGGEQTDMFYVFPVYCLSPSGSPVDSEFVIASVPGGATPTGLAFASTSGGAFTYNPTGSTVNISHVSTGQYQVTFASLAIAQVSGGTVIATANGSYGIYARCTVSNWQVGGGSTLQVSVACYDAAGNPEDNAFQILALPAMGYAYAFVVDTVVSSALNPGGGPVSAAGIYSDRSYTVTFPNSGIGAGWSVMVSGYQLGESCGPANWANSSVTVNCFNPSGLVTHDLGFEILAISNTNGSDIAFASYGLPQFSYNPAGTITTDHVSTGFYTVTFNGLNGNGGTVQVASPQNPVLCYSDGWGGSPFTALVLCTNSDGNPFDTEFNIMVIPAGATPPGINYALADQPTSQQYDADAGFTYDPSGPVPVQRFDTGQYEVSFPGGGTISGGTVSVTSQGGASGEATYCSPETGTPSQLFVNCYNVAGHLADSLFQVLTIAPVPGPPAFLGGGAGSPQSTPVTTPFGTAMTALVLDANNNPVPNVPVLFTAPNSGPSGTFPGASLTATTVSNASGVATAPTFTANSIAGGPYMVSASFIGAASANFSLTNTPLTSITLQTLPAGLAVSVDSGAPAASPVVAALVPGTSHTIATSTPQAGGTGIQYAWMNWSDGGTLSHNITVPASDTAYTATFQTQYLLTSSASPAAGGTLTLGNGSYYDPGTAVPVAATANPGYVFSNWSGPVANANSASTTVTMIGPETVTANFSLAAGITVQTSPEGLQFTLGGTTYTAPQTVNLSPGMYTLAVLATQAGSSGTQYAWMNWSDGGTLSHNITVSAASATYAANFQTEYLLTASAVPANAGTVSPNNSYVAAGSNTTLTASSQLPHIFSYWSGAASGTASSVLVAMNGPESATANFVSCDLNNDGVVDVKDLQILINQALGKAPPVTDLNHDGMVNAIDIQRLIAVILSD